MPLEIFFNGGILLLNFSSVPDLTLCVILESDVFPNADL
jgi:hypothetical protein